MGKSKQKAEGTSRKPVSRHRCLSWCRFNYLIFNYHMFSLGQANADVSAKTLPLQHREGEKDGDSGEVNRKGEKNYIINWDEKDVTDQ